LQTGTIRLSYNQSEALVNIPALDRRNQGLYSTSCGESLQGNLGHPIVQHSLQVDNRHESSPKIEQFEQQGFHR
jgi:hypothetical protein